MPFWLVSIFGFALPALFASLGAADGLQTVADRNSDSFQSWARGKILARKRGRHGSAPDVFEIAWRTE
jgi:hypothetical protein